MKNLCEKFGCLVNFQQRDRMEKNLTYEELLAENQNLKHRIMMLERMLFGSKKGSSQAERVRRSTGSF